MPRFVPRQRKHRVLQREKSYNKYGKESADPNIFQLLPESKSQREERKQKLREEFRAGQSKISSKKKKRLDKYIDNKLRKEENLEYLKKLSSQKVNTDQFISSKNLGKRTFDAFVADSGRHDGTERDRIQTHVGFDAESEDSLEETDSSSPISHPNTGQPGNAVALHPFLQASGSGLRTPLEMDENGLPVIQVRNKKTGSNTIAEAEVPWEGFDFEEDGDGGSSNVGVPEIQGAEKRTLHYSKGDEFEDMDAQERCSSGTDSDSETSQRARKSDNKRKSSQRTSGFKAWATEQINKSLGYTPSNVLDSAPQVTRVNQQPHSQAHTNVLDTNRPVSPSNNRKAFSVVLKRSDQVQKSRLMLPIVAEEQNIMEKVHNSPVVIVCGATGSGKTTQMPQFLFEAGYGSPDSPTPGLIGVTQPRRVAALSMAQRVREELGQFGDRVSYQIRFESTVSSKTAIKFMTDGILMRELTQDLLLRKYSAIVVDEAHERSINTDILIGILSRIVPRREELHKADPNITPLKVVIMSATLNVSAFLNQNLFRGLKVPVVEAEGRQYPVVNHFARTTRRDYLEETVRKVSKGHRKLPSGGMLVFLTGQSEIKVAIKRLQSLLGSRNVEGTNPARVHFSSSETPIETEDLELGGFAQSEDDEASDIDIVVNEENDEDFDNVQPLDTELTQPAKFPKRAHILPLYSQLPTIDQMRVFQTPPEGSRLIVLATNVAETSLTIPGIRYVFDCGRSKERVYKPERGIQSFEVGWISKASAEQRKGRAGRTGPGHCYRLYSSAVYERDFPEHSDPEILRTPMESVVLQVKSFHFPGNVANFPFPTPPSTEAVAMAEKLLRYLGAISPAGDITQLGKDLSMYPLSPRLGKMVVDGLQRGNLAHIIALVAALAIGDIFIPESQVNVHPVEHQEAEDHITTQEQQAEKHLREQEKDKYSRSRALLSRNDRQSDAVKVLTAVSLYSSATDQAGFCEENFIRSKAMQEVELLRNQLAQLVRVNHPTVIGATGSALEIKSKKELVILQEIIASGFIDQVAIRADLAPHPPEVFRKPKRAIDVPYLPLLLPSTGAASNLEEKAIYLHASSVLARHGPKDLPQYLVYSHLQESQSSLVGSEKAAKTRMFPLTPIEGGQLARIAHGTPLLRYGKPIGHVNVLTGTPKRQECWVVPELGVGNAGFGWPLPARKVVQVHDVKKGWVVEKFLT